MANALVAGKYRVLRRIAEGGMGEICLAAQVGPAGFERVVALKRMLASFTSDPAVQQLFLDEARLVAMLSHRNICQIIELGEDDGGYFVAMELVTGGSVLDLCKKVVLTTRAQLDPFFAVDIAAQVAEALAYAWAHPGPDGQPLRIIHRDVSPHNILLSTSGDVKLIDFGVAKSSVQKHETDLGMVKGKLAYLSPEQSRGEPLDGRSDLFALGVVLYEMVTGSKPFERVNPIETMRAIQYEPLPLLGPVYPSWAALDPVLAQLTAKKKEDRFADANHAAEALLDLRQALPRPRKRLGPMVAEVFDNELRELSQFIGLSKGELGRADTLVRLELKPAAILEAIQAARPPTAPPLPALPPEAPAVSSPRIPPPVSLPGTPRVNLPAAPRDPSRSIPPASATAPPPSQPSAQPQPQTESHALDSQPTLQVAPGDPMFAALMGTEAPPSAPAEAPRSQPPAPRRQTADIGRVRQPHRPLVVEGEDDERTIESTHFDRAELQGVQDAPPAAREPEKGTPLWMTALLIFLGALAIALVAFLYRQIMSEPVHKSDTTPTHIESPAPAPAP
jgi:serine/threonine-protein kinase